ncbi:hypothetical protein CIPAW_01G120600 [Carya illinoinensis]|uniref:Secreted protein n=1 Tax=Carya illinoinensis TaxID=32201 RepID=A0A8T1RPE4_CARIL|nr:hypothetical protein CIPAW_01G120600 [Carya illinoinensis]
MNYQWFSVRCSTVLVQILQLLMLAIPSTKAHKMCIAFPSIVCEVIICSGWKFKNMIILKWRLHQLLHRKDDGAAVPRDELNTGASIYSSSSNLGIDLW